VTEPKAGGGNSKLVIAGVLLLGGAAALFFMLQQPAPPPAAAPPPPKPQAAERVNPMAQPDLILEEAKDAGQPQQQVVEAEKPKVKHGPTRSEWDCSGELQRAAIQEVINNNRSQIRNCYERRLKVNNVLQGDLKLKFKVASNGHIGAAAVGGSLKDNEVFSCVRAIAQKWTFPPPSGGDCAVAEVPFQFSPKSN
jgi:outer membrane biosynthesis protein TonB